VPTRRDILKLALGTGAGLAGTSLGLGCGSKPPAPRIVQAPRPRYWVLILLSGGHDTLYTTDPKTASEVDDLVTLPTENRVVTAGELRLGPHFAPLSRWASELTVLNGVQVRTVNHDTGQKQFFHLKTNIVDMMPSVLDVVATRRSGQPLGVAYINLSSRVMHSPAYFGTADQFYFGKGDIFEQVARASPDELRTLSQVLRRQAGDIGRSGPAWREAEQTATYLAEVAEFFDHVAKVPPLVIAERSTDYVAQGMAESLDRALWLIEHDLCCGVVLDLGLARRDERELRQVLRRLPRRSPRAKESPRRARGADPHDRGLRAGPLPAPERHARQGSPATDVARVHGPGHPRRPIVRADRATHGRAPDRVPKRRPRRVGPRAAAR
jgi:hypothetical protein